MNLPERVDPASFKPVAHDLTLLWQEATAGLVARGSREIDGLHCRVVVAENKHRTASSCPRNGIEHGGIKLELVGNPAVVAVTPTAFGKVNAENAEPAEPGFDVAAFHIKTFDTKACFHTLRFGAAVDPHTRIARSLCRCKGAEPAVRFSDLRVQLVFKGADFLQTHNVGAGCIQKLSKAFSGTGP